MYIVYYFVVREFKVCCNIFCNSVILFVFKIISYFFLLGGVVVLGFINLNFFVELLFCSFIV